MKSTEGNKNEPTTVKPRRIKGKQRKVLKDRRAKRDQLRATAYHEAGHAVVDWLRGFRAVKLTIIPDAGRAGRQVHALVRDWGDLGFRFKFNQDHRIAVEFPDGTLRLATSAELILNELK